MSHGCELIVGADFVRAESGFENVPDGWNKKKNLQLRRQRVDVLASRAGGFQRREFSPTQV